MGKDNFKQVLLLIILCLGGLTTTAQARDLLGGSYYNHQILRYDGTTGMFIDVFAERFIADARAILGLLDDDNDS